MTLREAEEALGTLAVALPSAAVDAVDQGLQLLQERAEDLSSGPHAGELVAAGHPYRRGKSGKRQRGKAGYPPEVINIESGDFAGAWGHNVSLEGGDEISGEVFNTDPKAELLAEGTERMIARPLPEAAVRELEGKVLAVVEERLRKALGG